MKKMIFVFGSNLAGRHGKGAADSAKRLWGAQYGVGKGLTGQSYAIPTKDENFNVLPLEDIQKHVNDFLEFAKANKGWLFFVTAFGTELAGYSVTQIKGLFGDFSKLPYNIVFTKDWMT